MKQSIRTSSRACYIDITPTNTPRKPASSALVPRFTRRRIIDMPPLGERGTRTKLTRVLFWSICKCDVYMQLELDITAELKRELGHCFLAI